MLILKISERTQTYLYYFLFLLLGLLILIPWAYLDEVHQQYVFTPRRLIYGMVGATAFLIVWSEKIRVDQLTISTISLGFLGLHYLVNDYLEPRYLLMIFYLEISLLVFFAPVQVKVSALRVAPYFFYLLLLKAYLFRNGGFIHGGFLSSNLYATYILYFCMLEVYCRRYWNLVPAAIVVFFAGSKTVYVNFIALVLSLATRATVARTSLLAPPPSQMRIRLNLFHALGVAFICILAGATLVASSQSHRDWQAIIEPRREEITIINMLKYGALDSKMMEDQRIIEFQKRQKFFQQSGLFPIISNVRTSFRLRIEQYIYIQNNFFKFFFVGDTRGSQWETLGDNPHSAALDFISRFGVLFLLFILYAYRRLFISMNLIGFNIILIPILAFQPFGFSIGHSLPILCLVYTLSIHARHQKLSHHPVKGSCKKRRRQFSI